MILLNVCMCECRFGEDAMEVMESLNFLFRKFHQLNISNEEFSCLKTVTLLNHGNTHIHTDNTHTLTLIHTEIYFTTEQMCVI